MACPDPNSPPEPRSPGFTAGKVSIACLFLLRACRPCWSSVLNRGIACQDTDYSPSTVRSFTAWGSHVFSAPQSTPCCPSIVALPKNFPEREDGYTPLTCVFLGTRCKCARDVFTVHKEAPSLDSRRFYCGFLGLLGDASAWALHPSCWAPRDPQNPHTPTSESASWPCLRALPRDSQCLLVSISSRFLGLCL